MTNIIKYTALLIVLSLIAPAAADHDHADALSWPEAPHAFALGARFDTLAGNGDLPVVRGYDTRSGQPAYTWNEQSWESSGAAVDGELGFRCARATSTATEPAGISPAARGGSMPSPRSPSGGTFDP